MMRGPTVMILDALDGVDDERLRRVSARLLLWSVVAMVLNCGLYLTGFIDQKALIFVTLVLSWLAIVTTCAQTIITTDIKKSMDE